MRILVIGDVIGKLGRDVLKNVLPSLRREHRIDRIIANGENVAGGIGITPDTADELLISGVDVITTGNHVWHHKEIFPYLNNNNSIIRPLNYPPGVPGQGYVQLEDMMVVNLIGRTFIGTFECPFRAMDQLLSSGIKPPPVIIIDFHAEATSEKVALGRYLDGRVSAVLGTHTHVGTIDASVLPRGTAYVTDIGMVGPVESVIGDDIDAVINSFLTRIPHRLSVGKGKAMFNGIMVEINSLSGRAVGIERLTLKVG